ncbi:MAG TPA: A/G-specific adenine glycosylase, partial [Thermoanaerobaculia bacterium]
RIAARLERWFREHQRELPWRRRYHPYHVWISEVMLQQTRMDVVLGYYKRFVKRFPTIGALARASDEEVLALWSGLGYYRRAKMLRAGAIEVTERFRGKLPDDAETLRTIPGIGRYTAGAIASIAYGKREAIVDGNVARVVARLFAIPHAVPSRTFVDASWREAEALVAAARSPRDLNQALMEHGARVCKPRNPSCDSCVVARFCRAAAKGDPVSYPRRQRLKRSVRLSIPLYIVMDGRGKLLMRKESGSLMEALYHLPHGSSELFGECAPDRFHPGERLGAFLHTVTHRRIEFEVVSATLDSAVAEGPSEYAWIDPVELASLPHPSYVRKAMEVLATVSSRRDARDDVAAEVPPPLPPRYARGRSRRDDR